VCSKEGTVKQLWVYGLIFDVRSIRLCFTESGASKSLHDREVQMFGKAAGLNIQTKKRLWMRLKRPARPNRSNVRFVSPDTFFTFYPLWIGFPLAKVKK